MTMTIKRKLFALAAVTAACAIPATVAVGTTDDGASGDVGDQVIERMRAEAPPGTPTRAPWPLTGRGENMEIVANIPLDFGSDIELMGDYAFVGTYGSCPGSTPPAGSPPPGGCTAGTGGITVIDIADPEHPAVAGLFDCPGGQNDVQLSPDGKFAVMAIDTRNNACHPGEEGTVVLSLANPAQPVEVAWLPIRTAAGNLIGSHNNTLDWPILYIDQYQQSYNRIDMFDLSTPASPVKLSGVQFGSPRFGSSSPHDLIVDHRPDGRDLVYASSGGNTADVIDVTNPREPVILQRGVDPAVTFAHQAEANHDRDLLLVTDEYRGGGEARACGKTATQDGPRDNPTPPSGDRNNLGALYMYRLNPDGTIKGNGTAEGMSVAGTYNLPFQAGDNDQSLLHGAPGCTIHVFWQAPDEDRLVTAWYGKGTHVADFSDPARTKDLGWFIPDQADTWSAKPHNGYIFTGDIQRGFDVLKYTGEGGTRWPTTAGPAEVQRAKVQGAGPPAGAATTDSALASPAVTGETVVNSNPAPPRLASLAAVPGFQAELAKQREVGGARFDRTLKLPAGTRAGTAVATVRNAGGAIVSRMRFAVRTGQRSLKMRAEIAGLAGTYRYDVRLAGRTLARGSFRTTKSARSATLLLGEGQQLVCRIVT
jgi:hypothetical protein